MAGAIDFFCGMAKSELRALGRTKVCGVFYGYYFWDAGWPGGYHNSGHHALARVLASPHVDLVVSPHSYQERSPGGMYHPQFAAGSLRLNGKLFYNEEDTGTYKLPAGMDYCGPCPDLRTSLGALRRNAGPPAGARALVRSGSWRVPSPSLREGERRGASPPDLRLEDARYQFLWRVPRRFEAMTTRPGDS